MEVEHQLSPHFDTSVQNWFGTFWAFESKALGPIFEARAHIVNITHDLYVSNGVRLEKYFKVKRYDFFAYNFDLFELISRGAREIAIA